MILLRAVHIIFHGVISIIGSAISGAMDTIYQGISFLVLGTLDSMREKPLLWSGIIAALGALLHDEIIRILTFRQELAVKEKLPETVLIDEFVEFDPKLWQHLPQDLLQKVLSKFSVSRLAALRSVCKLWISVVIPSAALEIEESNQCALLYFDFLKDEIPDGWNGEEFGGSPWWMEVCRAGSDEESKSHLCRVDEYKARAKSDWTGSMHKFQPKSFPSQSREEQVRLLICERGLLFFGLMTRTDNQGARDRENQILRDIVVCNPLTSKSKILGLPCPIGPPCLAFKDLAWLDGDVLVGTAFDSKTGSYCLVAAGVNGTGESVTFLYDSFTSAWINASSLLSTLLQVGDELTELCTGLSRGVCLNGNLYWYVQTESSSPLEDVLQTKEFVLKFDLQHGTWRLIPIPEFCLECDFKPQMVLHEGGILLWHLHQELDARDEPCSSDLELELAPKITLMPRYVNDMVDEFSCEERDLHVCDHTAFSHGNLIYHVLELSASHSLFYQFLKVVVQDIEEDSYEELPILPEHNCSKHFTLSSRKVWRFSPSLTSVP